MMLIFGFTSTQAQTYVLNEGFEGATFPPEGWKVVDNDGDGHCWQLGSSGLKPKGKQLAVSYTVNPANPDDAYETQDNWLITPAIEVTNAAFKLNLTYIAESTEATEKMVIKISTTGTEVSDFADFYSEDASNGWYDDIVQQSLERSLSDYAGKTIYIAIIHQGKDTYGLGIDDVQVTNQQGPVAPTKFTVTAGAEGALTASLKWTNPSKNGAGDALDNLSVQVYRDGTLIATIDNATPGAEQTYEDTQVTTGNHTYGIVAVTTNGSSKTVEKSVYVGEDIPGAVSDFQAAIKDGHVQLSWVAPTTGKNKGYVNPANISYVIKQNTGDNSQDIATNVQGLTYTADVDPGVLHSYTIIAKNAVGEGVGVRSNGVIGYEQTLKDLLSGETDEIVYAAHRLPFTPYYKSSIGESLYYPADLMHAQGTIRHIVYKSNFNTASVTKNVTVWMGETDKTDLKDGWIAPSELTKVYDGPITLTAGINDVPIDLTTPFEYTGKNLVVFMQMGVSTSSAAYADRFYVKETTDHINCDRVYTSYSEIDNTALTSSTGEMGNWMPMTRFIVETKNSASLSGKVTNATTGQALADAKVEVPAYNLSATTDEEGHYSFYLVPSGEQTIKVSAVGYVGVEQNTTIQTSGEQTLDFALQPKATYTVKGKVVTKDDGKVADGAVVTLTGYSEHSTTTQSDGSFSIDGVYADEDYTLTVSLPLYDKYTVACNDNKAKDFGTISLVRSLIPAYGVTATAKEDGTSATVTWKDPVSRDGRTQWTHWGESDTQADTNGSYGDTDYNVAHAWDSTDIEDSAMVGMSFLKMRVFIQATRGTFTAKVWKGDKSNHVVLASKEIPADSISAEGKWVTVEFDAPGVEIKKGESYMVGVNCVNASSSPIGTAGFNTRIDGKNNLKWTEGSSYSYNGYYAWNISAYCGIPAAQTPVSTTSSAPKCAYKVYRKAATDAQAVQLTSTPVSTLSYEDDSWDRLPAGKYVYSVKAVYKSGESAEAYSDTLARAVNVDASVQSFVAPVKSKDPVSSVKVSVKIENLGEKPLASVPVSVTVNGGTPLTATYTGTLNKGETADVELGTIELTANSAYTLVATTAVEGDETAANNTCTMVLPNYDDVELHGYRWDAYSDAGIMRINSNIPEQAYFQHELTPGDALITAGEYFDGHYYAFTATWYSEPKQFVEIDPASWSLVNQIENDVFVQDMTYDYTAKTMYGICIDGDNSALCTINLNTGEVSVIGTLGKVFRTIAASKQGVLYAIDSEGNLCTVDKTTGTPTVVGSTGVSDVSYLQSMTFDYKSGRLFWAHTGTKSQGTLYEVDPATAKVTPLGTTLYDGKDAAEIVGLYVADNGLNTGISSVTTADGSQNVYAGADGLHVVLAPGERAQVNVYGVSGALVKTVEVEGTTVVNLSGIPSGAYVASVRTNKGRVYNSRPFLLK